ncbi:alpha/beta hydrolase [Thalassiella azotivora]
MPEPPAHRVPVAGGRLAVHELAAGPPASRARDDDGAPADRPLVVALHGITANALSWTAVAERLAGRVRLVAPDLRGRAASADVPGPVGLAAHADDVVAVLDALGADDAVLVGHSMGAFVAALTAARHPGRVRLLVLVDGGVGFPAPEGTDLDAVLEAVIGPAMRRLSMTFADRDAHLAYWREHPALGPLLDTAAGPHLERYLDHDLVPADTGGLRSSCRLDAVRADGRDVLTDARTLAAVRSSGVPTSLLWAPRGLLDEPQGLYDESRLAAAGLPGTVTVRRVDGTNHYSVLLAPAGVDAVAQAVVEAAEAH